LRILLADARQNGEYFNEAWGPCRLTVLGGLPSNGAELGGGWAAAISGTRSAWEAAYECRGERLTLSREMG
jgi:hypothetical protein